MELTELKTENCLIVSISGRLDTTNYTTLEKKLMNWIDKGEQHILVDCAKLNYVSSSGLRVFLVALKKITPLNGKFVLCSLQKNIIEIFDISGFSSIFEIYSTKEEALAAF